MTEHAKPLTLRVSEAHDAYRALLAEMLDSLRSLPADIIDQDDIRQMENFAASANEMNCHVIYEAAAAIREHETGMKLSALASLSMRDLLQTGASNP